MRHCFFFVVVFTAALGAACGSDSDNQPAVGEADGFWLLSSLEVEGEAIMFEEPMFLEIDGNQVGGNTTCNDFGGEYGGDVTMTAMGCEPDDDPSIDLHRIQDAMIDAVLSGPQLAGDRLTFTTPSAQLVYESVEDPDPVHLFSVLEDENRVASTDEIYLDPEAGRHLDYESLVRLTHPGTAAFFYIGVEGELVCLIVATDSASSTRCQQPRFAARQDQATDLGSRDGPVGLRSALIPDAFIAAFEARPDLGEMSTNILLVRDDAPPGSHTVDGPEGERFTLEIP